jgi:hypothetical protein
LAFLKLIFWIVLAGLVVLLWKDSPRVDLPIGGQYDVNARLMTFILLGFAMGFVPLYIWQRAKQWRIGRRIKSMEIELAELRKRAFPPVTPMPSVVGETALIAEELI